MSYHVLVLRDSFTLKSTVGKIYFNGDYFSESLEDVSRGRGIKIMENTCIPEGTYLVDVNFSGRFQREMPIIFNQPNRYQIIAGEIEFKGCRFHGGNTHLSTAGCPLTARTRVDSDTIYDSMEKELTALLIKNGRKGFVTFVNQI